MFKFRLQTLLRLRIAERDQRRAELAKAIRAEEMLRGDLRKLGQERAEAVQRGRELKSPGSANVDALLQTHRYEMVLAAQSRQLETQIAQVQAEAERRRLILVEADRQVRVLEKLRERQAAAHRREADRLEMKQLDEAAVLGYVHRREAMR
jgi:flagellar FliJ protein